MTSLSLPNGPFLLALSPSGFEKKKEHNGKKEGGKISTERFYENLSPFYSAMTFKEKKNTEKNTTSSQCYEGIAGMEKAQTVPATGYPTSRSEQT